MHEPLQTALSMLLGDVELLDADSVGGGCISETKRVTIQDQNALQSLFVKSNDVSFIDNYQCEWSGLQRLSDVQTIRIPKPIAVGNAAGKSWLILEWIEQWRTPTDYFAAFGKQLAELHRATLGSNIGADRDNYLGAAIQKNASTGSWSDFVADNRIGFQIRWAADQGYDDQQLLHDCESIAQRMDELLSGRDEKTSLLHGDLWSGNYLCDSSGSPVIIDPAVYRGCREAEFGMLKLFGSCPPEFYESYQSTWPMPDGWQQRSDIYVLYHLLNHLNLFGYGYLGQCKLLAAKILRT